MAIEYRAEIDGLRMVAVLPVVLFHAGVSTLRGGFLGVDVFFVISGYLIVSILAREIARGEFSLLRFYERRARRILPALYGVILACAPFAWLWLSPADFVRFGESVVATALFGSNIYFNDKIGYFTPDVETYPLIHTWSLGVEEQFYAVAPVLLLLAFRFGRRGAFAMLLAATLASLAAAQVMSARDAQADFYLPHYRAWELGLGGLIALAPPKALLRGRAFREGAALLGLLLLVGAFLALDRDMRMPNLWALAPTGGAALIIAFARGDTWVGRLLSLRPCVAVGAISYSVYLWHQPLFAFARVVKDGAPPALTMAALTMLTFLLAALSWRFVERPFRARSGLTRRAVFAGALACGLVLVAGGRIAAIAHGFPARSPEFAAIAEWENLYAHRAIACQSDARKQIPPEQACLFPENGASPHYALLGDSHGGMFADALGKALGARSESLLDLRSSGCPPIRGLVFSDSARRTCAAFNERVFAHLSPRADVGTLILAARWAVAFEGQLSAPPGREADGRAQPADANGVLLQPPELYEALGALYRAQIQAWLNMGRRVVLVYSTPEAPWNVPRRVVHNSYAGRPFGPAPLSIGYDAYLARVRNVHAQLDRIPDHPNLLRVRPEEIFCNGAAPGGCVVESDGKPLYYDDNHLNDIGGAMLADAVAQAMRGRGW
ncbi:Peptidoglycan/LPS O-acetylase OafA/YrhL, contains acyltransferase and SGNH-hydrolase domains [Rhodoblastus acidophilus]|uniref:Peptidoglycan/LPS O-acetylase OafA/YrhL, contains acyltransferase and SGNH-hydrolase domains n=1 Tax=Rhodoblastus acidophilus TaxID=1074 RepID=A0A212REE4_RHOAC|nr:acyltransferase family protein [Rhodoblastus acidophilus]PPQ39728.1 acyltransferase [Rhodoblastus acidophilus]RAI16533.1 acyltransferase [Rhodoblastus acidophilus]SNB70715.1 Peptidoglycan/LPS O-acetylase OafA/YrhL, contains acyltransferase and SGNH-hydrolase domains [Rhodoblastus acidophilus]